MCTEALVFVNIFPHKAENLLINLSFSEGGKQLTKEFNVASPKRWVHILDRAFVPNSADDEIGTKQQRESINKTNEFKTALAHVINIYLCWDGAGREGEVF